MPIKLTFTGNAVAGPATRLLPGTEVKPVWNLVGLHSERNSTVGDLLQKVDTPRTARRLWQQLFAFENSLGILMNSNGVVHDPQTKRPLISLVQGVFQNLFENSAAISIGSGFWLEMCNGGNLAECTSSIGPVLERR